MSERRILILRACGLVEEKKECDNIKCQAELYGLEVHDYCPKTNEELLNVLNKGISYDYIYLSSHGDIQGFSNEAGTINIDWNDFGVHLCDSMCMEPDCIVMLSCCRAGLNQIAYILFYCCDKIAYIVGPRQSLFPHDMLIGFNILLYNLQHRGVDPIVACEKIKQGTDIRFVCFDRLEIEAEVGYLAWKQEFEKIREHDKKEGPKIKDVLDSKGYIPIEAIELRRQELERKLNTES